MKGTGGEGFFQCFFGGRPSVWQICDERERLRVKCTGKSGKERYIMARAISIGRQDFEKIRSDNCFYIDKTDFIRQWWEERDDVTLITRPDVLGKR